MEHLLKDRKNKFAGIVYPTIGGEHEDAMFEDFPMEKYHADKTRMSSTGVRKLLHSPKSFRHWLAGQDDEDEDYFRYGRAVHMFLLEPRKFQALYVVQPDFGAMQSSKNREKRDTWRADQDPDAVILTEQELDEMLDIFDALTEHEQAGQLLKNGVPEVTGFWKHEATGVHCRIRPDYLARDKDGNLYVIDIKTTKNASPGLFATDCARHGYDVQLAFYSDGIQKIMKQEPSSAAIIAIEKPSKRSPCSVHVYWMIDDWMDTGRAQYERGLRTYVQSMETGLWPGPQGAGTILMPPAWHNTGGPHD